MNKRRTHITIALDIDNKIKEYAEVRKISYSEAISQIVTLGFGNTDMMKKTDQMNSLLDRIYSKLCYTVALLEQSYSDFDWDKISDPEESKALNQFKANLSKYKIEK